MSTTVNINWLSALAPGLDWKTTVPPVILYLNLVLLPLIFLINTLHFKTLLHKQLRPFFQLHIFLCVSNFLYCLTAWTPALLYFLRSPEDYCNRSFSYLEVTVTLVLGTIRESVLIFSTWIVLYMDLYSGLGIFMEVFRKPKVAFWNMVIVMVMCSFGGLCLWPKHSIQEVNVDFDCNMALKPLKNPRYLAIITEETLQSYQLNTKLIQNVKLFPVIAYFPAVVLLVVVNIIVKCKRIEQEERPVPSVPLSIVYSFLFAATQFFEIYSTRDLQYSTIFAQWYTVAMVLNIFLQYLICFIGSKKYREILKKMLRGSRTPSTVGTI